MSDGVLWKLGDHTPGKHLVLQRYLNAWYPILGLTQERILFIDGFAGPGEYEGGEPGSPIIALRTLKAHAAKGRFRAEVVFVFVEEEPRRVAHLQKLIGEEKDGLPASCAVEVIAGRFDSTITEALDDLDAAKQDLAPCFLMVDPFGVSDTPMSLIHRVLRHPKSEVYISFMYEAINRFKTTAEFAPNLDSLFGCPEWRDGIGITDAAAKRDFFFGLYRRQLKTAGAQYVLQFELYQENRLVYAIFFGSHHLVGCDRMKQAIWKVAPFGDFAFRGARGGQLALAVGDANLSAFGQELCEAFRSDAWVAVESLEEFAQSDRTEFHTGHLRPALRMLEKRGHLTADPASRSRRMTFPRGTRVKFQVVAA